MAKTECQEAASRLAKCGSRKRAASGQFVSQKRSKGAPFPKGPSASQVNIQKRSKGAPFPKGPSAAQVNMPAPKKKITPEIKKLDTEKEKKMKEMQAYIERLEKMVEKPKAIESIPSQMPQAMKNALKVAEKVEKNIEKYKDTGVESDAQAIRDDINDVKKKYENLMTLKKMRAARKKLDDEVGRMKQSALDLARQLDKQMGVVGEAAKKREKTFAQTGRPGLKKVTFKGRRKETGRSGKRRAK